MCKTLFPAQAYSKGSSGFRPPITRPPTTSPTPKYYSQRTSKRPKPKATPGSGGHPIYGNMNPVTVIRSVFKAKKKQQQQQQKNRVYESECECLWKTLVQLCHVTKAWNSSRLWICLPEHDRRHLRHLRQQRQEEERRERVRRRRL